MKVTVTKLPETAPRSHPLHLNSKQPSQFAGHFLFTQVISGLTETPVKIILHDRLTGKRTMLEIEQEDDDIVVVEPIDESSLKEVEIAAVPRLVVAVPSRAAAPTPSPTPRPPPSAPPAPKAVPTVAKAPAPSPSLTASVVTSKAPSPSPIMKK